jgi:hypothetical protein
MKKENDFWKNLKQLAEELKDRPDWMYAGITLNPKIYKTYEPARSARNTQKI